MKVIQKYSCGICNKEYNDIDSAYKCCNKRGTVTVNTPEKESYDFVGKVKKWYKDFQALPQKKKADKIRQYMITGISIIIGIKILQAILGRFI